MKTSITIVALAIAVFCDAQDYVAPELLSSGGGQIELPAMFVTYSIGEPIIGLATSSDYVLTEGFQQSELDSVLISIEEFEEIEFNVYPNPNNGTLTIEFESLEHSNIEMSIIDIAGREVLNRTFLESKVLEIDVSNLTNGTYTITLLNGANKLGSSKIIKQ